MRTLATRNLPTNPNTHPAGAPTPIPDITGQIIDGIDALRQRITNRLRFRRGDWFLNRNEGIPYGELLQHPGNLRLLEQAITNALRTLQEVTSITNIQTNYTPNNRTFEYTAVVHSIYGDINLNETVG